jgi:hypothetical protein
MNRSNTMAMTVEIKGNKLCIEIDLEKPTPSASGKTLVVASTRGNAVTDVMVDGKPVTIGRTPISSTDSKAVKVSCFDSHWVDNSFVPA